MATKKFLSVCLASLLVMFGLAAEVSTLLVSAGDIRVRQTGPVALEEGASSLGFHRREATPGSALERENILYW